jgi:AmpD protein
MVVDSDTGLLDSAEQVNSPNFDDRPQDTQVDLLVIHNISLPPGQFGGPWISDLFTNQLNPEAHPYFKEIHSLKVSAHILIRRDGSIIQFVPFHKRAWHAGQSNYGGRNRCNDFSIGIELEGSDDHPFEEPQYQQLTALIKALLQAYPSLSTEHITGHSDIAPGRKTDPGPYFDWQKLRILLA